MKTTALIATLITLAVPATAGAHHRHHHHRALLATLSGTGTLAGATGTMTSAKLGNGTFAAAVTTTGAATTRTGDRGTLSCAPAAAALTLTGTSTTQLALTGKSCTWTPAGSTSSTSMFWGKTTTGTLAKAFIVRKADGSVKGAAFAGFDRQLFTQFSTRLRDAEHRTGDCDH